MRIICIRLSSLVRRSVAAAAVFALAMSETAASQLGGDFGAGSYDYSGLTSESFENKLASRTADLDIADAAVRAAKAELTQARIELALSALDVSAAWIQYIAVSASGDDDALRASWAAVGTALRAYKTVRDVEEYSAEALETSLTSRTYAQFWKAQLENDWREAQAGRGVADTYSVADDIARCRPGRGRACSASGFLNRDTRFTVFQPTLALVGVHHAHAKGLTGRGVRVAIEDDAVNYQLPEFSGRVSFKGARLVYPRPLTTTAPFGANEWNYASEAYEPNATEDRYIHEALTADAVVRLEGDWTQEIWLENRHEDVLSWDRWAVIPPVESETADISHGTRVASVAVGRDFGVAPGATLIPIYKDLSDSAQEEQYAWSRYLLDYLTTATPLERNEWDKNLAKSVRADYSNYDVINRSFGIGVFDPASISYFLDDGTQWWGEELRRLLPLTWRAYMQTDVHPEDRAVVVYAAGNETEEFGGLGADIPRYERHVRGHQLSVMAVDDDGKHSFYTNFCGPLPANWDASRWGRHFCLAAPGTVNAVSNVPGWAYQGTSGTSFAAPIVTGAIALLMEHFRHQLGNTEIVKRVVNTANNRGRYADVEVYGAGLLDLQAALQPVGRTFTGTQSTNADAMRTAISVPRAMGNLGLRLAAQGVEVASLDSLGAPFWSAPTWHILPVDARVVAIPTFSEPEEEGGGTPHLGFTRGTIAGPTGGQGVHFLVGKDRAGLERAPVDGFRWGIVGDATSWQGGSASGAFGDEVRSVTAWIGRSTRIELGDAWNLRASATVGLGHAFLASGGMLDVDAHALSTWDLGLEHGERGRGRWSRIGLTQPLRAESGEATLSYLRGLDSGFPVYDRATVSLAPEGRELELAFTHEAPIGWGRGVIEVAHSWDAGHEPGKTSARIGAAYRLHW